MKEAGKIKLLQILLHSHCVKSVQIGPNAEKYGLYLSVFSPNSEKYGPEITPYLDTFHAVSRLV